MRSIATALAAIAALGTGGAVFAQAQNSGSTTTSPPSKPAQQHKAPEREDGAAENSAADPDNVQNGKDDATEASERAEGPERAEKGDKADQGEKGEQAEHGEDTDRGSAERSDDDGARGHADEPAGPNAAHEVEGVE